MNTIGLSALERNVAALAAASPDAATRIQTAPPRPDLVWIDTPDGVPSATITDLDPLGLAQVSRSLASQRRPLEEARRLTEPVKIADAAVLVVLGFGLGYHVAELARRVRKTGIIVVFEPDVSLLRSVLERLDLADWIEQTNLVILTDAADPAAMARAVQGNEHALALGTQIVEHPASRARLGEAARQFQAAFTDVVRAARTTVVTTMVQTQATLRNLTQNIDHYALGPGIEDLRDAARGRPAVVVAAGPSLQRNVDLLARPGVRDRVVIIAAQTVLKTLLARGIRPHFVTALDFHEISARFYEGLTAGDVEGITLVVEPKVNPAVTSAFPGAIRCAADAFLDLVLGNDLARPMGAIRPGATVAHLAYYLARWLGCDPVALIGQDLGFTDGQYYAAGAAIHDVWAGELNGFNTLEMLEWQRIARHRHTLRRATDTLGRPVYTDEQMATYLVQFERDFATDARAGLTTIDATEGGVAKRHTAPATLAEFLDRAAAGPALPRLPEPPGDRGGDRRARARAVGERIRSVRRDVHAVGTLSRQAEGVLIEMREHHADQQRVNRLIVKVEAVRDRVTRLQPAFELVQRMNQTGAFRRTRADRAINIEAEADPLTRQRLQIERDTANVRSLAEAADALGDLLDAALGALGGGAKRTRDPLSPAAAPAAGPPAADAPAAVVAPPVHAVVPLIGPAWRAAALRPVAGRPALERTVARLASARRPAGITLLCDDPDAARTLTASMRLPGSVRFAQASQGDPAGRRAVAAARAFALDCWRAGIGGLTCYDELIDPGTLAEAMRRLDIASALLAGPDWCLVDPTLCDALIDRYSEDPSGHRLTFTASAPGFAPVLIDRALADDLARNRPTAGSFASIGGLLGYVPIAPAPDLIARSMCVPAPIAARDALRRCTADTDAQALLLTGAMARARIDADAADAGQIAAALAGFARAEPMEFARTGPQTVELRLPDDPADAPAASILAERLGALASLAPGAPLTIRGPLGPALIAGAAHARSLGFTAVHVRTDLANPDADPVALLSDADIISVDLHGQTEPAYRSHPAARPGGFASAQRHLTRLLESRPTGGLPLPWIVPRLTRRDEVYEQIEPFYDTWLMRLGAAVIDPLPASVPGARIGPLPLPAMALRRLALSGLVIDAAGRCLIDPRGLKHEAAGRLGEAPPAQLWERVLAARTTGATGAAP